MSKNLQYKVCGLNDLDNLEAILALRPNYIGQIFFADSPRCTDPDTLINSLSLDFLDTQKVSVVVNEKIINIIQIIKDYQFDIVQLHGDEDAEFCKLLRERSDIKIWKAFGVNEDFNFESLEAYLEYVDLFLFDANCKGYGGSGQSFNWKLLNQYKFDLPFMLSGGINPNNIDEAQEFARNFNHCIGLDLNSGFEISPGIKDINLLSKYL